MIVRITLHLLYYTNITVLHFRQIGVDACFTESVLIIKGLSKEITIRIMSSKMRQSLLICI